MPDGVTNEQSLSDSAAVPLPGAALPETPRTEPPAAQPTGRSAFSQTRARTGDARPPVNIRFSVPFFGKGFYFAFVGGKERRGHERIVLERRRNPIKTRANLAFIFIGAMALYMLTLGLFLVCASGA